MAEAVRADRHDRDCRREQLAGAVERIGLPTPMTERLVLHATADLVELLPRQRDQVERVGDLHGIGSIVSNTLR